MSNLLLVFLMTQTAPIYAGLECRASEVKKALETLARNRESKCMNVEQMRAASHALRELASEPACDHSTLVKAQRLLAEARVAPLLNDTKLSCDNLLLSIEAHLKQLTKSVKTESRPAAVGQ
ncbi:MAG: hypothetical protein AB7N80_07285 [Bdellovibrionales bacterium]